MKIFIALHHYLFSIYFFSIFLLVASVLPACAFGDPPKILVINSYHSNFSWVKCYSTALRKHLGPTVELTVFDMNTECVPRQQFQARADTAYAFFIKTRPDVVVLGDDDAVKYLATSIASIGTPVVYLGLNNNPRNYGLDTDLPITGILERPLVKRSIALLKDIFNGSLNRCMILFDDSTTSRVIMESVFQNNSRAVFYDVSVDIVVTNDLSVWEANVVNARASGYDAIFTGLPHTITDEAGLPVESDDLLRWSSENTPVPLFGFWDTAIGREFAAGGFVLSGEPQGRLAARLVKDILDGQDPSYIPPHTAEHGRFLFSRHGLERFGIILPESIADQAFYTD